MKIIDMHTHVFPQYVNLAVEVLDRCGIESCVTLEWHDGFGDTLRRHLETFNAYPGRFIVFGNVDFKRINEPDFGEKAARQMEKDVAAGMRGLKIYKALGLEYRHPDGSFWRVNDPSLDPIWAAAGQLGIPILIHTADPMSFWEPVNEFNFWNGVLYGEYAWWTYYRKGLPCPEELLGERNEVIARHPKTTFIAPHVGSRSDCLDWAADDLDAFPNLYYDIAARIPILGRNARWAAHSREFLLAYQDRILFGTDMIYDDTNVPTGMQAQALYQPFEIPLDGADPARRYVDTSCEFFQSHLDFLLTDRVQTRPPFKRRQQGITITGLNLPADACQKILYTNARRLLGGALA
jgi:predicted TIM-barrel fold metal-dependent hydrolase